MSGTVGRKVVKYVSLDPDLISLMDEEKGHEPLSSYINRMLRKAHGLDS